MHSKAKAAAEETPPGPSADLLEDFRKIGITESHLHHWASRGPSGGTRDEPLLSPAAVREAAMKRRGRCEAETGEATPRSVLRLRCFFWEFLSSWLQRAYGGVFAIGGWGG